MKMLSGAILRTSIADLEAMLATTKAPVGDELDAYDPDEVSAHLEEGDEYEGLLAAPCHPELVYAVVQGSVESAGLFGGKSKHEPFDLAAIVFRQARKFLDRVDEDAGDLYLTWVETRERLLAALVDKGQWSVIPRLVDAGLLELPGEMSQLYFSEDVIPAEDLVRLWHTTALMNQGEFDRAKVVLVTMTEHASCASVLLRPAIDFALQPLPVDPDEVDAYLEDTYVGDAPAVPLLFEHERRAAEKMGIGIDDNTEPMSEHVDHDEIYVGLMRSALRAVPVYYARYRAATREYAKENGLAPVHRPGAPGPRIATSFVVDDPDEEEGLGDDDSFGPMDPSFWTTPAPAVALPTAKKAPVVWQPRR